MDSLNNDSKSRFLKDLQSGVNNSESDKIPDISVLSDTIDLLEKIVTRINQSAQIGALSEKTQHKDSVIKTSLSLNYSEKLEMEQTLEFLREQVETFKQLLYHKELELQEIQQELAQTNEDLFTALNLTCLTLDEAIVLVKEILVNKKPIKAETFATLLSAIYNSTVEPQELEQEEKSNSLKLLINIPGNCIPTNDSTYQIQSTVLISQAREIRTKSQIVRQQSPGIRAKSKELKNQFIQQGIKFVSS